MLFLYCVTAYEDKKQSQRLVANDSVLVIWFRLSFSGLFLILPHSYIAVLVIVPESTRLGRLNLGVIITCGIGEIGIVGAN